MLQAEATAVEEERRGAARRLGAKQVRTLRVARSMPAVLPRR